MRKLVITIAGHDRPGIIHEVSAALADQQGSIHEINQTTMHGEFAGLFTCAMPDHSQDVQKFTEVLSRTLEGSGLFHWVSAGDDLDETRPPRPREIYIVVLRGHNRMGVIPSFSGAVAEFNVNIDSLRTMPVTGEHDVDQVTMVFKLSASTEVNKRAFRQHLNRMAEKLGMELSLLPRDIFEVISRM
ncbi:MAG: ACT domain-containing protein [Candidatus Adiutrix sp.]|jgi:glycine cleavage system transcriptional repressor|nr:ACT domain-containing protein [Candidatus Adiutrix sp.]